jgi:hypothetical protein
MYCHTILKRDNPQVLAVQFRDLPPKAMAISLDLCVRGIIDNADAPFLFQIRPLSQDFPLKVLGELVVGHR